MKMSRMAFALIVTIALASTAGATTVVNGVDIGNNITIFDGRNSPSSSNSWYKGTNEDQEVEPGMVATQFWDLEAFYLNSKLLTVVSGFNFLGYGGEKAGDIFIESNGANAGYDFVFDMDYTNKLYDIYAITSSAILANANVPANASSNPFAYMSGGTKINTNKIAFVMTSTTSNIDTITGGTHYLASVDLSPLAIDTAFTAHFTESCGNDNLMGSTRVPEPGTMALFGAGLVALAGFRRMVKR